MRRGDMADHSHPLSPLKSIALQVAPIPNQPFKSNEIFCREKHSTGAICMANIGRNGMMGTKAANCKGMDNGFNRVGEDKG